MTGIGEWKPEILSLLRDRPVWTMSAGECDALAETLKLTRRELEIIGLLLRSLREDEIAGELGISVHTVHTHLGRIYRKLNVRSLSGLVLRLASFCRVLRCGSQTLNSGAGVPKATLTLRSTERIP